jgi:hypothetical protein
MTLDPTIQYTKEEKEFEHEILGLRDAHNS